MSHYTPPPKVRPSFPKRAVVTGGMPYGNKSLHFGHIGGVFIHADVFARFLRDRIGEDNVIFVSGTDCYGSPIVEHHRKLCLDGYEKSLTQFVESNHNDQKETLDKYQVTPNFYAASSMGSAAEKHKDISHLIFNTLLENGHLERRETLQFFDTVHQVFLNGRQVIGQCPLDGCRSEKGYADECDFGHQYLPQELKNPKSTLSETQPEMKTIANWYLDLPKFTGALKEWIEEANSRPGSRRPAISSIKEFFAEPIVYVVKKHIEELLAVQSFLPSHELNDSQKKSVALTFASLTDRERACEILSSKSIPYRTGKTLVPFRLTGNIKWGIPVPQVNDNDDLTFWVWPESLWAPISFTASYLESIGKEKESWKEWWCSKDSVVYQFIGEDNVYFYGPAEMALFMGLQGEEFSSDPKEGDLQLPELIVNRHLLFLDSKASSSGKIKPPMAQDLLKHYSSAQLRSHFISLGLGSKNISFRPKSYDPKAQEKIPDPVEKEGKLLSNIFNRVVWKIVEGLHSHNNSKIPLSKISEETRTHTESAIINYEIAMDKKLFHQALKTADQYLRNLNKFLGKGQKSLQTWSKPEQDVFWADALYMLRFSLLFMHPITPAGCERIQKVLNLNNNLWSWSNINVNITKFMTDPSTHSINQILPEENFFSN